MKTCSIIGRMLAAAAVATAPGGAALGEVKPARIFSSHMVLQRDMPVPVWGTAAAGEAVTVTFRDQTKKAVAGADGKWMVRLDALAVGEPARLTVAGAGHTVAFDDVLVGEVWLGSGQSNMSRSVSAFGKDDPALVKLAGSGPYPRLRMIRFDPEKDNQWEVAAGKACTSFSSMMFAFGQPLQQKLDVPVGLILSAVAGTPSGRWVDPRGLAADPVCLKLLGATGPIDPNDAAKQVQALTDKLVASAKEAGQNPVRREGIEIGSLYAEYISPVIPYAIRGVLWDQGEAGTAHRTIKQKDMMRALISGWRAAWGQGDFAFLINPKPSGGGCAFDYKDPVTCMANEFSPLPDKRRGAGGDGGLRQEYLSLTKLPNVAIVTVSDLGGGTHPKNKYGYGQRGCRVALGFVYKLPVEYSGPVYASHTAEAGAIRVRYTHVGKGLAFANGEKIQGFEVAGADRDYEWADAVIDGETVVVRSKSVAAPVHVRYGWDDRPVWANLFNKDGLPAIPFSSDTGGSE